MIGVPIGYRIGRVTGQVLDQTIFGSPKVETEGSKLERVLFSICGLWKVYTNYLWASKAIWQHYLGQ
ncbi:MAG: hypothetical protein MRQ09_03155 [Candidatus Midichloria sp.]|nr:hypothetical protein [Candidatus Midichloria sp.]